MRSYGQYCALAKALDIVGDRWTLLIVRELLVRACRYSDLQDGLPGVATNLLAERLRQLEESGVVTRDDEGRYVLTKWGEYLAEPLESLSRWASPLMQQMGDDETFRGRWLIMPVAFIFGGHDPLRPAFVAEVRADGEAVTIESAGGDVTFRPGPARSPDLVLSGPPYAIIGILAGFLDKKAATALGLSVLGDHRPLARLRRADWKTGPESCQINV
jgi:DNA-binding HxlR family transcriptional regulator